MGEMIFGIALSVVVLLIVVVVIILVSCMLSKRNERYPLLTVPATVAAKRTYIRNSDGDSYSQYYATFRFEGGDRLELLVSRNQVGDLVEGDCGNLTFQGRRFLDFKRT